MNVLNICYLSGALGRQYTDCTEWVHLVLFKFFSFFGGFVFLNYLNSLIVYAWFQECWKWMRRYVLVHCGSRVLWKNTFCRCSVFIYVCRWFCLCTKRFLYYVPDPCPAKSLFTTTLLIKTRISTMSQRNHFIPWNEIWQHIWASDIQWHLLIYITTKDVLGYVKEITNTSLQSVIIK